MASRSKQVKIYLSEEQYEMLRKLAEEQGVSVPALVKSLVLGFLGEAGPPKCSDIVSRIEELEKKYEQLAKEVGRIEVDLALLMKRRSRNEYR